MSKTILTTIKATIIAIAIIAFMVSMLPLSYVAYETWLNIFAGSVVILPIFQLFEWAFYGVAKLIRHLNIKYFSKRDS